MGAGGCPGEARPPGRRASSGATVDGITVGGAPRVRYHGRSEGTAMALKKLGHVVLKVRDLGRSEAFHTSVLGLGLTGRMAGANLSVYFQDPDGQMLEVTYEKP